MKNLFLLFVLISGLFYGCSRDESSIENTETNLRFEEPDLYGCYYSGTITIEYSEKYGEHAIPNIRADYMGRSNPCWAFAMALLQPTDPYLDRWKVYSCPCTPDGDSDDLDTTIDNDPRLSQRGNTGD